MRKLRLEFEYECYPLWDITDIKNNGVVNLNPLDLEIPSELKSELMKLDKEFQATYDINNPQYSGFISKEKAIKFAENAIIINENLKKYLDIEEFKLLNPNDLIISS